MVAVCNERLAIFYPENPRINCCRGDARIDGLSRGFQEGERSSLRVIIIGIDGGDCAGFLREDFDVRDLEIMVCAINYPGRDRSGFEAKKLEVEGRCGLRPLQRDLAEIDSFLNGFPGSYAEHRKGRTASKFDGRVR